MTHPTILVTGATGTIGRQVAQNLIARGVSIVVASRTPSRLADLVEQSGGLAEARALDLEDSSTFDALEGMRTLFMVGPQSEGFGDTVAPVLAAAKEAGVTHVVRYSALGADRDAFFPLAREHGVGEEAVEASGIAWTILQPTFYQDNVIHFQGDAIRSTGAFYGASRDGKVAYVASADIAAVATEVLLQPGAHAGQRYVLTGPEALSDDEVASRLSDALGRSVRYVDIGDDAIADNLREAGTSAFMVESMVGLEQVKRNGWAAEVSPAVEELLGRPATSIETLLQARADELRAPAARPS